MIPKVAGVKPKTRIQQQDSLKSSALTVLTLVQLCQQLLDEGPTLFVIACDSATDSSMLSLP